MISVRRILTVGVALAVFACAFVTDASATRDPSQVVGLSASFRATMNDFADDGATAEQAAAIDAAIAVLETEQKSFKKSLVKNSKAIKNLDKVMAGTEPYDTQVETLINFYDVAFGTCGLEANQAILNGKGSLIGKAKKAAALSRKFTKTANYVRDTTKPRFKRIKKMVGGMGAAEKIVKKANKNK